MPTQLLLEPHPCRSAPIKVSPQVYTHVLHCNRIDVYAFVKQMFKMYQVSMLEIHYITIATTAKQPNVVSLEADPQICEYPIACPYVPINFNTHLTHTTHSHTPHTCTHTHTTHTCTHTPPIHTHSQRWQAKAWSLLGSECCSY